MSDTLRGAFSAPADRAGRQHVVWHATAADEVLSTLETSANGLTAAEAAIRLERFGPNALPRTGERGPVARFLQQFQNILIYVLLGASALSAAIGHVTDSLVVLAVVLVNAVVGFIQEGRAAKALEAIRGMIDPQASVMRDGRRLSVAAAEIVPGDLVLLDPGDRVPADLRLLRARNLRMNEAALTGESVPADKSPDSVAVDAPLGDRSSMALSGTLVAAGQGLGIAVATGAATELGRVSELVAEVELFKTPLIRQVDGFARQLTLAVLGVSALVFGVAVGVRDYAWSEAFMVVVGLAVAAIPEGLPAVMTITLAVGVRRMAKYNAIIRRLPAVETLGSVSVICSDKTGTLTRNEMTACSLITGDLRVEVSGTGYAPTGSLRTGGRELHPTELKDLGTLVRAALLCNDAVLRRTTQGWFVHGDPMEGALISLAMKAGEDPEQVRGLFPRLDEIPFDAQHRFMASLHRAGDGARLVYLKGAPEKLLAMCTRQWGGLGDGALDSARWESCLENLAARGQRVIALGMKQLPGKDALTIGDVEKGITLLGLVGLIDPPREEAIAAVHDCQTAGIRVQMITGDHAATARAIAIQLGISKDPKVVTGLILDSMEAPHLRRVVRETAVFARASPENKLRIVEAHRANGDVVAMTGDGVNDAPALKRADVGVAMGRKGTEAAKEASEMVLVDDNFATIVTAVREGRTVYDNLKKVIAWTLPTNGGEACAIIAAVAFGTTLPLTPIQILWINMVTAVALGLALAFEPTEPHTMRRPPRPADEPLLGPLLLWRIAFVSGLFVLGAFGMFYWALGREAPLETARTIVVNTLVVMEIFYMFSVRYVHGTSLTWRGVLGTPAVLIGIAAVTAGQVAFTYLPALQTTFESRSLTIAEGIAVIGAGIVLLLVVEIEKTMVRRIEARRTALKQRRGPRKPGSEISESDS